MQEYDIVLIGTGQATGAIVGALTGDGKTVATIESDRVGGSCVNYGCTPTKTLVASARAAHVVRRAGDFGVEVRDAVTRYSQVASRLNGMRSPASAGFRSWLEEVTDFYPGHASFVDAHTLRIVDSESGKQTDIRGETIIIHTGTRARKPDVPGIDAVPWLDNKGVLDLTDIPRHLIVVGGSYIGLEFAQAFRRLGSEVTVLHRGDRLIDREDAEVGATAREVLASEGVRIVLRASVSRVDRRDDGVEAVVSGDAAGSTIRGSHILFGIGRVPNSDALNLERAGVTTDARGFIPVDDYGRTSVPHIYALGDVNGRGAFTHTSVHDGQVFLEHYRGTGERKISDRTRVYSMFIDPPLARVGMSDAEARESGRPVLVARMDMSAVSRAREKAETAGFMKFLVETGTNKILGATIFGVGGDEIIGMLALAIQAGLPYTALQDTVLPHPTVSELVPWAFDNLSPLK
ncbi:MAG: mercuric reductase [Spirochaetaceae bacterium]